MQPTVRTLDQLVKETNDIYDPQRQMNQQAIATAGTRMGENERYLGMQQENAFGQIDQRAASRGALFGGFGADAQAKYTSEKYLPALAQLRSDTENTINNLNRDTLSLNSDQRSRAFDTREGDITKKFEYDKGVEERQWQTKQAELAYQREMEKLRSQQSFEADQNNKNRAAQASQSAASNSATSGQAASSMYGELSKVVGQDGFISPTSWAKAKSLWVANGYDSKSFNNTFASFKNPKNPYYK